MEVPIGRVGRITAGEEAGQFVIVRDDQEQTGGFLVLQSAAPDVFSADEVFDSWVERREGLAAFLAEAG